MVLQMAGSCSFCGKDRREVFAIAGVVGTETRICDRCVGLCLDILDDEREELSRLAEAGKPDPAGPPSTDDELERLLREASAKAGADPRGELIEAIQARLEARSQRPPARRRDFHCSFCDRSRQDVRKLISGPQVFICDDCAGDAAGLLAASGWRFRASV
jgi:hypothetical protein